MPHYHNPLQIECGMLSAKELVRKLKEEEEKGEIYETLEQNGMGTSGWDWRAGTEGERKKVQIQAQLNQERYHLNISANANQ